jgi:hypothetical protein
MRILLRTTMPMPCRAAILDSPIFSPVAEVSAIPCSIQSPIEILIHLCSEKKSKKNKIKIEHLLEFQPAHHGNVDA